MNVGFYALVTKSRKPAKGKRGQPGRFVTLKTGRVIFIPKGKREKWADVREKIKARREPGKLTGLMPEANLRDLTLGEGGGLYGATTAGGEVDTYAYHPGSGKLLAYGPYGELQHVGLIEKYAGQKFHYDDWVKMVKEGDELFIWTERLARDQRDQVNLAMEAARAMQAAGFPDDTPLTLSRHGDPYLEISLGGAKREVGRKKERIKSIAADVAAGKKNFVGVELLQTENLIGADLSDSLFWGTDFKEASLVGTNFSGANLRAANLTRSENTFADFSKANMRKAKLHDADLTYTKLVGADLRGADMTSSWLGGADLSGADLRGADLRKAHGKRDVKGYEGIIWDDTTKGLLKAWKVAGKRG